MSATQPTTAATRSYRVYLRGQRNVLALPFEVNLASDKAAREFAALMLDKEAVCPCAEIWERARLVCTVRRNE